jgi:hypothetical protein
MATKTKAPDACRLTVTIRGVAYTARPVDSDVPEVIKAWRLSRPDGTTYVVADTIDGATCECGDFVFRHEGTGTACKHIAALQALALLDGEDGSPETWPSWTATHAYTPGRGRAARCTTTTQSCGFCGGSGRVPGRQFDRDGRHRPDLPATVTCSYCGGSGMCVEGSKLLPARNPNLDR